MSGRGGFECQSMVLEVDGKEFEMGNHGPLFDDLESLPNRVLAIANLVNDRFTFHDSAKNLDQFYFYLGVRQSSNLTTTGAMDQLMVDALWHIVGHPDRFWSLEAWLAELFPDCTLELCFDRYSIKRLKQFCENPVAWIKGVTGNAKRRESLENKLRDADELVPQLQDFLEMIEAADAKGDDRLRLGNDKQDLFYLKLSHSSAAFKRRLAALRGALEFAVSIRAFRRPTVFFGDGLNLHFSQLSSGEQNLISTGARLFAFAASGSLILIDEPEVSLNVSWQQRYIELIAEALEYAPGSHVIIASHSPHLVSDLRSGNSTVVVARRKQGNGRLAFRSHPGEFWGWGSEAILYEVLGLSSASNYHFSRELAVVLKLVTEKSKDAEKFKRFLSKCDQMDFGDEAEPLKVVIEEIRNYAGGLKE